MKPNNYAHHTCNSVVDRLIALGIDTFFIAPGSRSAPIVSAIVRNVSARIYLGIDERSVGFMALGYGKRAEKPGVVVVTSGTACANLYPAITEAFMSAVPMLVITADRPFELHDCGANQTVFQSRMFANHVVKNFDLGPPSPLIPMDALLAIFENAVWAGTGAKKGPVHVNMQLREPLANLPHPHEIPWETSVHTHRVFAANKIATRPHADLLDALVGPGLIVVGELLPQHGQEKILAFAQRCGWPIFADIASNMRTIVDDKIVTHYDLKLLNPDFRKSLDTIKTIVKFGSRIVSKRLWQWIEERPSSTTLVSLDETPDRIDQTGRFTHVFIGDVTLFLNDVLERLPRNIAPTSLVPANAIDNAVVGFLESAHNNEGYFVARAIARMREPVNIFLSSGMPIRDADQFAHPTFVQIDTLVNRGTSGIDGIISTAVGISVADQKPTMVLLGDVAFLHDTNGLMLVKHCAMPLLIIVINNAGGGIFHFLPIAKEADVVSPYFDSPHDVKLDALCHAHDVRHLSVKSARDFDNALDEFFSRRQSLVVEVHIERDANVRLHQDVYQKIAALRLS